MGLFRCSQCGCVENTALSRYWKDRQERQPPRCSACDPRIGAWHGQFPRQDARAAGYQQDQYGSLWSPQSIRQGSVPADRVLCDVDAVPAPPAAGEGEG